MYNSQADTVIRSFRKWNLSVVKERKIDQGSIVKIEEKRKVFYTSVEKIVSVKKWSNMKQSCPSWFWEPAL